MQVPLLDLKAQYATIKEEVEAAIAEVMASQHFILGPKVVACESAIAKYSACAHGIGVPAPVLEIVWVSPLSRLWS